MNDPLSTESIHRALNDYNRPGEAPREEMWTAISASLPAGPVRARRRFLVPGVLWAAAIAAAFVLGVQVGDWRGGDRQQEVATAPPAAPMLDPYLRDHLARTAMLLAAFRAEAPTGAVSAGTVAAANQLLVENRVLHDDPLAAGAEIARLMEDVELVLVQIALLAASHAPAEIDLVEDALDAQGIIPRLTAWFASDGRTYGG
jgi:hypothetical protein